MRGISAPSGTACPARWSLEGLTCRSNQPSCTGVFDDDTQSCTDTYLPCTCTRAAGGAARNNNKTWACPAAKCRAPDKRCQCRDNGSVGEGLACYREGLNCPIYGYVVGCYNMWNDDLKICENYTAILGECDCYRGAWMCSYGDCRIPSYECDPDYYPPDYSP